MPLKSRDSVSSALLRASLWLGALSAAGAVALMAWHSAFRTTEALAHSRPMAAAGIGIIVSLALYLASHLLRPGKKSPALLALHAGFLLLVSGYMAETAFSERGLVFIAEGMTVTKYVDEKGWDRKLPVALRLENFALELYPGTARPSDFISDISVTDPETKDAKPFRVTSESPLVASWGELYQKACGVESTGLEEIIVDVRRGGRTDTFRTRPGQTVMLPGGGQITVLDFSPSLGFRDGRAFTVDPDLMLNPGYLARAERGAEENTEWVLGRDGETEILPRLFVSFRDFYGVEYTVFAFERDRFRFLVYLGMALAILGFGALFLKKPEPRK